MKQVTKEQILNMAKDENLFSVYQMTLHKEKYNLIPELLYEKSISK